jgi:molybdopterin/thiamine biosynthesis adenylyltransferase
MRIGSSAPAEAVSADTHPVLLLVVACYAAGAILKTIFGGPLQAPGPAASIGLTIPIIDIVGPDPSWLAVEFELTDTYLAGAGAIGNGFLYALSLLRVSGTLVIVDPDTVGDGNLNRCVWFTAADIGLPKAVRLSELAQASFLRLGLIPKTKTLQQVGKEQATDTWLKRLIVAVDSRRTRRHLQHEIPGEVFDASTTGTVECVFHYHVQPTDDACLACIYHETTDELARERHMAETLGVELDDIKQHYVQSAAARRIHTRYPDVPLEELEGQAYDTLFKALCSEGKLLSPDNRQVLAPFAFVSVLAGTYLAIELGRRVVLGQVAHDFNYWRISPWAPPFVNMRDMRRRREDCEFCGQPLLLRTALRLWIG